MHNSREKQLRSCASAHHAPKHVDAPTIAPKSPARVLLRLRAVLLLPIYHRQTRACDGWQTHYYTLSVIQNAQRNRTPHEKQARIRRTAVRKPPIAPIEPSTWPALAIRYCRPMIRSLGYLVGGKVGIDRPGITCNQGRGKDEMSFTRCVWNALPVVWTVWLTALLPLLHQDAFDYRK